MIIKYSDNFLSSFHKLTKKDSVIRKIIKKQFKLFCVNHKHPSLRLHKLSGEKSEYWSISITRSIRVTFRYIKDGILIIDIGTHDEVY